MLAPSQGFQEQLAKTQAIGTEVVFDPVDTEEGLKKLQGLVQGNIMVGEEEVMEWDAIRATCGEEGFELDLDNADDLPDLTEDEIAAVNLMLEEEAEAENQEVLAEKIEEKEQLPAEEAKKDAKKRLFKATASNAASNKLRIAKALASPRKKTSARTGNRNGDQRNQQESKASSHFLLDHPKH